jgi:hypothetical protein
LKLAASGRMVGIVIILIVIWELGSCFGLSEPGTRKKAWHVLRWN